MSVKDALNRYFTRTAKELEPKERRRNAKPEREVQKAVLAWLKVNGFSVNLIEAKAVYSQAAGRYVNGQTAPGVPDLVGCTSDGLGAYIELKAKGRRSTLRPGQRAFLEQKIMLGAFAVCIDSVECLSTIWDSYCHRRKVDPMLARNLLLKHLPPKRESNGNDYIFDMEGA